MIKISLKKNKLLSNLKKSWPKAPAARYFVSAALVVLLAVALWLNKSLFVAAMVNNRPIGRWELEKRMVSRYGSSTIDEIASEMIIQQAAVAKKVTVSTAEIDAKISEIEKSLGDKITLTEALTQQGMTISDLKKQIQLQLMLEKMVGDQSSYTQKDMDDYIEKNKGSLTATDAAGMRDEAAKMLVSTKKNDAIRQLFTDLKAKASIVKFLN